MMSEQIFGKTFVKLALAGSLLLASATVLAQTSVSLSSESGQPGQTVTVDFTFTGDGSQEALQAEAEIATIAPFSSIDASNMCSGASAVVVSCQRSGTTLQFAAANGSGTPLQSFSGTIDFTIDAGAATPQTVALTWTTSDPSFTPDSSTNGEVAITAGPQSELQVTPDPIAFGSWDQNDLPQTQAVTVTNIGDGGPANISSVSLATGAEFTLSSDTCSGAALAANGGSCTVDVVFDTSTNGSYSDTFSVSSDADNNPNPSVAVTGTATSQPSLSASPAGGAVNFGNVLIGTSQSQNVTVSNSGSADGNYSCDFTTSTPEITTTPASPFSSMVTANGGSDSFSISCSVPDTAADGTTYNATLSCSGDAGFSETYDISCTATDIIPLPVPTNSKWGLAILSLLVLMIGGLTVRFFRA